MNNFDQLSDIGQQLLRQENYPLDSDYREYRMKLENALTMAERRERRTGHLVWMSFLVALILMFVGGLEVVGPFDPTEDDANIVSMVFSVIYAVSVIIFPISLASYLSRFWPRAVSARCQLQEAHQMVVLTELAEMRREIARLAGPPKRK